MGKKRRAEVDLDAERTLYASFVCAANSISQLYTQAIQQQRKSSAAASRQTLERVLAFIVREYENADTIPKAALLQFLQQDYETVEGSEHLPHQFPVQLLPVVSQGPTAPAHSDDSVQEKQAQQPALQQPMCPARQPMHAQTLASPAMRGRFSGMAAMETGEHSMDASQGSAGPLPMPGAHFSTFSSGGLSGFPDLASLRAGGA